MKFKIKTEKLAELLGDVQLPAAKVGVAGTGLVLVEASEGEVKVTATDLDITITRRFKAELERPGVCAVHSRKLSALSKSLPNPMAEVRTNPDKTKLGIFSGTAKATLPTVPVDEFPATESRQGGFEASVRTEDFHNSLNQVHYAAAKDGTRYICMGVCLEAGENHLKFVATDTKRVSVAEAEATISEPFKVIVPSKTIERLLKILPKSKDKITINVHPNTIIFEWEQGRMESKLIEGDFPNYLPLLDQIESRSTIVLEKDVLLGAIRRASGASGGEGVISLYFRSATLADKDVLGGSQGAIVVSLPESTDGSYSEIIPLEKAPEKESRVSFFSEYLMEPVAACPSNSLVFRYGDSSDICFLQDGTSFLAVIATVRETA
jgi:DNA polymerase-3 subunit beta